MQDTDSSTSLARLGTAFKRAPVDEGALRDAVCAYVDEMKQLGAPVERVIIDIKRVMHVDEARGLRDPKRPDARRLAEDAVSWCIAHYYKGKRD